MRNWSRSDAFETQCSRRKLTELSLQGFGSWKQRRFGVTTAWQVVRRWPGDGVRRVLNQHYLLSQHTLSR